MADGDYERREQKAAELKRMTRIMQSARLSAKNNCANDTKSPQFSSDTNESWE
jgi:hypothetical protein